MDSGTQNQEGPIFFRESSSSWAQAVLIGMAVMLWCTAIIVGGFLSLKEEIYSVRVVQCSMLAPAFVPAGYCPEVGDE